MGKYFHFQSNDDDNIINEPMKVYQCQFIKANNQRCKRWCIIGTEYCFQHRIQAKKVDIETSNIPNSGNGLFADNGTNNNEIVFKKDKSYLHIKQMKCL